MRGPQAPYSKRLLNCQFHDFCADLMQDVDATDVPCLGIEQIAMDHARTTTAARYLRRSNTALFYIIDPRNRSLSFGRKTSRVLYRL